jgi:DNA polymerase-3 subunit epsilon
MIRPKRSNQPAFIQKYREETNPWLARPTPLDSLRLVALDTECSGFDIQKDRLLSVSVIDIDWSTIQLNTSYEWLVYQSNMVANEATKIHGILPSDTLQGIPEKQMLEELLPRISGAVIVGHQIWFDALMLNSALRRNFGIGFRNSTIDVALLAMNELQPFRKSGYKNQRPPSMEDLCAHYGIPPHDRHTAEGDAYIAAELFLLLCGQVRRRKEKINRRDLLIRKFSTL